MLMIPLGPISANDYYEIEYIRQSGYSLLLFARHAVTSEHVVIKILRKYKDTVFSLETISERQQCQLEALHWNRVFTPKVYIGLAAICSLDLYQKSIGIDKVIINPTKEMLDPNAEYVLLMHQL